MSKSKVKFVRLMAVRVAAGAVAAIRESLVVKARKSKAVGVILMTASGDVYEPHGTLITETPAGIRAWLPEPRTAENGATLAPISEWLDGDSKGAVESALCWVNIRAADATKRVAEPRYLKLLLKRHSIAGEEVDGQVVVFATTRDGESLSDEERAELESVAESVLGALKL